MVETETPKPGDNLGSAAKLSKCPGWASLCLHQGGRGEKQQSAPSLWGPQSCGASQEGLK